MQFNIIDHNVSLTTNIFLVIANIINLFYNIPQMYKTYKCKSTKDFSTLFLSFRFIGNLIWVEYAVEIGSLLMLINNVVTVISTLFIGYYKINELYLEYKIKKIIKK
jgi:MtN3 and saliva related transmembrane protein